MRCVHPLPLFGTIWCSVPLMSALEWSRVSTSVKHLWHLLSYCIAGLTWGCLAYPWSTFLMSCPMRRLGDHMVNVLHFCFQFTLLPLLPLARLHPLFLINRTSQALMFLDKLCNRTGPVFPTFCLPTVPGRFSPRLLSALFLFLCQLSKTNLD